jgi:hypothetical protein
MINEAHLAVNSIRTIFADLDRDVRHFAES